MEAKHLRVRVEKNKKEVVNLTMPIYSLKVIHTVMPQSVLDSLKSRNIDLNKMRDEVAASGDQPQTLFEQELEDEGIDKKYRVWIE